jgi:hypothetical protein
VETLHPVEIPHAYSMFYFRAMQSFRLAQSFQDLLVPGCSRAGEGAREQDRCHGRAPSAFGVAWRSNELFAEQFVRISKSGTTTNVQVTIAPVARQADTWVTGTA